MEYETELHVPPDKGIVVVTGSIGRIGDAVMRRFAGRFEGIVGFDRKVPRAPTAGVRLHARRD